MSKLIETLKNNGWVETTLGECWVGEEVLLIQAGRIPRALTVTRVHRETCVGETSDGTTRANEAPVLRPPRPECAPGTVALITWDGQDEPMRAMRLNEDWVVVDNGYVLEGSAEVVRVLLPADQDTPPIEVTDEMVERAAEACYFASYAMIPAAPSWGRACEEFPDGAAAFRREARAALKAVLEKEK